VGMDLTDSPAPLDDAALQQARYVIAIGDTGIDAATVGGAYLTWDIGGEIDDTDEQGVAGVLTDIDRRVRHFLLAVDPDHELHDALLAGDGASAP